MRCIRQGFSLVEVAVVLVIVTILLATFALPLGAQMQLRKSAETQRQLEAAREALYGFAASNGRLPCPATATSAGQESPTLGGPCTTLVGLLPAATLGIAPIDEGGFAIDAWADGSANHRIGYAVSNSEMSALTTANGVKMVTMPTLALQTHLFVCATGLMTAPPTANCGPAVVLSKDAPAVIFSLGRLATASSPDEINNQNGDKVFSSGIANPGFDDQLVWLSLHTLFDRMVRAGRLP